MYDLSLNKKAPPKWQGFYCIGNYYDLASLSAAIAVVNTPVTNALT